MNKNIVIDRKRINELNASSKSISVFLDEPDVRYNGELIEETPGFIKFYDVQAEIIISVPWSKISEVDYWEGQWTIEQLKDAKMSQEQLRHQEVGREVT